MHSLQHLQAGLFEDTRCFGKIFPPFGFCLSLFPFSLVDARMFWFCLNLLNPCPIFSVRNLPADLSLLVPSQFDPDFQTPLILGESLDLSDSEESQFVSAFSDGLWAKSEPILSMSAFQKPVAGAIIGTLHFEELGLS